VVDTWQGSPGNPYEQGVVISAVQLRFATQRLRFEAFDLQYSSQPFSAQDYSPSASSFDENEMLQLC